MEQRINILERTKSIDCICNVYPHMINKLLNGISKEKLNINTNFSDGNKSLESKCIEIIEAVKSLELVETTFLNRFELNEEQSLKRADEMLIDIFTIYEKYEVPRNGDGCLDWNTKGAFQDFNWGMLFNRHIYLCHLIKAYEISGDGKYIECVDRIIRDWIISNPWVPRRSYEDVEWNIRPWRTLEVALRAKVWAQIFVKLLNNPHVSDSCRILMLASMTDHAEHIQHHTAWPDHEYPNIYHTELVGCAILGQVFYFFKDSKKWVKYGIDHFEKDLLPTQTYPDGVQKELATQYHKVALLDYEEIIRIGEATGCKCSDKTYQVAERMVNYLVESIKPNGNALLNGDSPVTTHEKMLLDRADRYKRDDWHYILSKGKQGKNKEKIPSRIFPWAGQLIMRDSFTKDAQWAFFNAGPYGVTAHGHRDKLHLSLFAYGRELLVDSGGTRYIQDKWLLDYYRESSAGHNVILMNGKSQCKGELEAKKPLDTYTITDDVDYIKATFAEGYYDKEIDYNKPVEHQKHTRSVYYVRGRYWLVIDEVQADISCNIKPLWHFHPSCTVIKDDSKVMTNDDGVGNLMIIPITKADLTCELIKGQEEPVIQGWYNTSFDHREPTYCAVYNADIDETTVIGWLMIPFIGHKPEVEFECEEVNSHTLNYRIVYEGREDNFTIYSDDKTPTTIQLGDKRIEI